MNDLDELRMDFLEILHDNLHIELDRANVIVELLIEKVEPLIEERIENA